MTRGTNGRGRGQGTARGAATRARGGPAARGNATTAARPTAATTVTRPTVATTAARPTAATTVTRPAQARARAPLAPIQNNTPPSTDPEEGHDEDQGPQEPPAYVGKRKRTYDEIAGALSIRATAKRQKIDNEILEPYYQLGRWTQRGIDLDPDVHHIVKVGIALSVDFSEMEGIESFAASEEVLDDYTKEEQTSMLTLFNEMVAYEPDLEALLVEIIKYEDIDTFNNLLDELLNKVHQARTSDLNRLKTLTSTFLAPNPHVKALDPPLTVSISKSDRGINHPVIAALFCPREHVFRMLEELDDYTLYIDGDTDDDEGEDDEDEDEEPDEEENEGERATIPEDTTVVEYIQRGGVQLTADGMDAFLYDLRKIEMGENHSSKLKGFLQGYILPRAYRALFLGPRSVLEDSTKKSRPSVAALHRMSKVTPRTIAYAIVLARFSMSDVESWSLEDGSYNLRDLYDLIVRLLSDPESIFAKRTLRWWNDKVLGRKNGKSKRVAPKDVVPGTSAFNKLVAAEAARSLRRAEKAEERRQREEAERRQAEAAARQKALEHIRAQRQQRQQPAQPEEDDGDGGDGSEGGVVGQGEGEGTDDEMDGAGEGGEGEGEVDDMIQGRSGGDDEGGSENESDDDEDPTMRGARQHQHQNQRGQDSEDYASEVWDRFGQDLPQGSHGARSGVNQDLRGGSAPSSRGSRGGISQVHGGGGGPVSKGIRGSSVTPSSRGAVSQGTRGGSVSRSVTPSSRGGASGSRGGILQSRGGVPVSRGTKKKAV
ncbi:hypothetical protein VKT23_015363 [Stygiomarasmius scandens]|uniref:Uncharacterized protein n=1 Tax=Marasmiellus scandens TaxID=2682957 RepID=A0ABR1J2P3_9AGAR